MSTASSQSLPLDRIGPAVRPEGANAGTQRWRELLFVHWSVPLESVRPLIPSALDLDPWDGRAWIGLVPFRMEATRTSFMPRAIGGLEFLELNLRTYVHHQGRPGVWFFSLEAASWLAVRGARAIWNLPYFHARMSAERIGDHVHYESARRDRTAPRFGVDYEIGEALGPSEPGTIEHFLLERYLLFSSKRGSILEGQVHHLPYYAHRARLDRIEDELLGAAGLPQPDRPPEAVHWSPGVEVEVFGPRRT